MTDAEGRDRQQLPHFDAEAAECFDAKAGINSRHGEDELLRRGSGSVCHFRTDDGEHRTGAADEHGRVADRDFQATDASTAVGGHGEKRGWTEVVITVLWALAVANDGPANDDDILVVQSSLRRSLKVCFSDVQKIAESGLFPAAEQHDLSLHEDGIGRAGVSANLPNRITLID